MDLFKQCLVLFALGFVVDLIQTVHIQACAQRQMMLSVTTIVGIYIVGYWGHQWFVEHKTSWSRWWITVAGALGAGLGTAAVIAFGE